MIRTIFFVLLTFGTTLSIAQSPYAFDWKKEGAVCAFGLSTWGTSYLLDQDRTVLSTEQLLDMRSARVNSFDRVATNNYSASAQKTSDILSLGSKMLPLLLLLDKNPRQDFETIAALYAETFLVANGMTTFSKTAVQRPRPFVYNENVALSVKQTADAHRSFISGHTSKTAAMTFLTAKIYADYHPDSEWKPLIWAAAATVPAITGYMRVKAGKHFPTDVMAGYAVGALTGILVPQLHKVVKGKTGNLNMSLGMNGAQVSLVF